MAIEARIWPLREAMTMFTGGHSRSSAWSTQAVRIVRAARWVNWQVVRVSGLVVIAGRDKIGSVALVDTIREIVGAENGVRSWFAIGQAGPLHSLSSRWNTNRIFQ